MFMRYCVILQSNRTVATVLCGNTEYTRQPLDEKNILYHYGIIYDYESSVWSKILLSMLLPRR